MEEFSFEKKTKTLRELITEKQINIDEGSGTALSVSVKL